MNAKTTEAAGVAGALAVLEQVKGVVFNFAPRSLSTELTAALATLQARLKTADEVLGAALELQSKLARAESRLLAADELREALGAGLRIGGAYGQELHFYGQAFTTLDAALAAYDKAGTNEH